MDDSPHHGDDNFDRGANEKLSSNHCGVSSSNDWQSPMTQLPEGQSEYLSEMWLRNLCAYCGRTIKQGTRVGSGRKSEGGFCSLSCYTKYYQMELIARAQW